MGDLELSGMLNLTGVLNLVAQGGTVKVAGAEVVVESQPGGTAHTNAAPPVILPPPPASPIDPEPGVWALSSMNKTVTVAGVPIIAQGMVIQGGNPPTWPGMVLPSQGNPTVTANMLPINVVGDQAAVFPSGAAVPLTESGQ